MRTVYCVKFDVDNNSYFGFKYPIREKPQGLEIPEAKCVINDISKAKLLANKYRTESSFNNIRILEIKVK